MAGSKKAAEERGFPQQDYDAYREKLKVASDKWEKLHAARVESTFSWADASPADLRDMVAAVVADGSAVLLAATADGGALVIQILNGKGRHKLYPTNEEELQVAIHEVTAIAES